MISIASGPVTIQTSAQSVPSPPGWMGEVTLILLASRRRRSTPSRMKTSSRIQIAGVVTQPGERRAWHIISQWVWNEAPGTEPSVARLRRCAAPSLPQHTSPQQISRFSHLHTGMDRSRKPCVGLAGRFSGRDAGSPAQWHAPFPGWAVSAWERSAQRGRWQPACSLCGQHSQLPPLPASAEQCQWQSSLTAKPEPA
jgi:hypothetical protein